MGQNKVNMGQDNAKTSQNNPGRVERIVEMGESVISPLAATEQVVRGAIDRVRRTAGLQ